MIEQDEHEAVEGAVPPAVDLAHLSRQTLGDARLEREVLALFVEQAVSIRSAIAAADAEERRQLAHGLVGSARAVGAFALADCAARIEEAPQGEALLERLSLLVDEVRLFTGARHG